MSDPILSLSMSLRLVAETNKREHWATKARRVKAQRLATAWALSARRGALGVVQTVLREYGLVVTIRRVASRSLDPLENLPASMKAVADEIAKWVGEDDRKGSRLRFVPDQRRGGVGEYAVEIEMRAAPAGASTS